MVEKFIERGTDYPLQHGKLSIYETNCSCKNVKFYFKRHVLTLMLQGHKTIETDNVKFEFFPGSFLIPEKETINTISIPNASVNNPTKCLVLELTPSYLQSIYEDILHTTNNSQLLHNEPTDGDKKIFVSNDKLLIQAFTRLYKHQLEHKTANKSLIDDLIIKEVLLRLFCTEGLNLLKMDFEQSIEDTAVRKVISFIQNNIKEKLTTEKLTEISGLGQTTFFKKFKVCTGHTPIDYIRHERVRQAKIMIKKGNYRLQEIAYKCGFNSYEYFCSSFKKIEKAKPSDFKKKIYSSNTVYS
ncbi:putative transcriptional regulator (AraC/XylS family) protein [unidentified eubacterium SCB49]|nr:putative transcriptional regulator (AraC/XylS family) protein [unidentified eubacterium SCB49]